jgi:hypothetical protein
MILPLSVEGQDVLTLPLLLVPDRCVSATHRPIYTNASEIYF